MSRNLALLACFVLCLFGLIAAPAAADFGFAEQGLTITNQDGSAATQAGSHPFAVTASFALNSHPEGAEDVGDGWLRDIDIAQIPGLVGDATSYPRCSTAEFLTTVEISNPGCADEAAVGVTAAALGGHSWQGVAVYNLEPPPGVAARIGFQILTVKLVVDLTVARRPPHNLIARARRIPQIFYVVKSRTQLWGNPSDPAHDSLRGHCEGQHEELGPGVEFEFENTSGETCPVSPRPRPFITLPTRCSGQNTTGFTADSWEAPAAVLPDGEPDQSDPAWSTASSELRDAEGNPQPFTGCDKLSFKPQITAAPTARATTSPSGLDFSLDVHDEGLTSVKGTAQSDIRKAVVTLPRGMSVNPSIAAGLEVCTEAQLAEEKLESDPGSGCPDASKIGTIEVESPLVDAPLTGSLYQAEPYANPFGSLIAFYFVVRNPTLGVIITQPAQVISDPDTGQLTTIADDIPQLPFSHFRLHFREGARSPLVTPPSCGTHTVKALLYPWSGGPPVESTSAFQIVSGPSETPCPTGGLPPFSPSLSGGTVNNAAGSFSPFNLRISRTDSEQEITHFSIKLPPGVTGKLAGIATCPDVAIQQAIGRTGPLGGHEELASPSCPAASYVGRTLVGSGVGPSLAYAPGKLYLAGPYHGAPLSIVAITAGVVGPFDIGTVVVREALRIDPETAEVFVDATDSDPIPHIIKGIPVHLRDIRVYTDRPEFVLNPTDCTRTSTASTVLGSGLDFASPADDNPFVATSPFQAADCAALPFAPKLGFRLKGATHRGAHPSLSAHVAMKGIGEAAIRYARVTLPHSEFLEQGHIGTICTRVQFKSGSVPGENCPAASVYGRVRAVTPILDGALEGPIFLRSSEHPLPDLVAALHHDEINIALVGRIDSVKGQIRNTFDFVPDAPVTSADFVFGAGKKSLLVNSTNICKGKHTVKVELKGHNGKQVTYRTALKATACKNARPMGKGRHPRPLPRQRD